MRKKVYIYTRVSTSMQVDGYSLDAQKEKIRKYAEAFDYDVVGEYEDAGKSGKSIEGRAEFRKMLEDIETCKDGVSYVMVFKLSRFGRNAADVLNSLQLMQDYGVNLICVEDGIDSSKDAGKLMISVLSAVAEIERENILVQTMEGRKQKAREGKWNGGFAPYGYKLVNGELQIAEDEAEAVRIIFDRYVNTSMGCNGVAKYLQQQGIQKKERQNGKNPFFAASLVKQIIKNPVYCGKIAFGRRSNQKVQGTRDKYHIVEQSDYLIADGIHEAIVGEDLWQKAQDKLAAQAKKYEHVNKGKDEKIHLLSGILKCPICGAGMYGNKSIKNRNGVHYKDYYYYGCKHRGALNGHKCTYKKQLQEEKIDGAVAEIISKLISNPKFAAIMQEKIDMKVDTTEIDKELANYQKILGQFIGTKRSLEQQIDSLNINDRHYNRKLADLQDRLDAMYDKIEEEEEKLEECKAKKRAIESDKMTADNIYKVLIYFDKLYAVMDDADKRALLYSLIEDVQVYEQAQANGQWLKSLKFKLPIIEGNMNLSLDNGSHVETVVLLSKLKSTHHIEVEISMDEMDLTKAESKATYAEIKAYVLEKFGLKVSQLYIAQVKRKHGLIERINYNMGDGKSRVPQVTPEKEKAIEDALRYFQMIE